MGVNPNVPYDAVLNVKFGAVSLWNLHVVLIFIV